MKLIIKNFKEHCAEDRNRTYSSFVVQRHTPLCFLHESVALTTCATGPTCGIYDSSPTLQNAETLIMFRCQINQRRFEGFIYRMCLQQDSNPRFFTILGIVAIDHSAIQTKKWEDLRNANSDATSQYLTIDVYSLFTSKFS